MTKQISEERKTAYYVGTGIIVLGFIVFGSNFLIIAISLGQSHSQPDGMWFGLRAVGGVALLALGTFVQRIGARGLAGSGVILDPESAREDLEPYARMAGGMAKDAVEASGLNLGGRPQQVVMIKCRTCRTLNAEDAKFCKECGKPV